MLKALESLDVGTAFNAGLAIVVMAIVLDRVTTAASVRAEARYRASARAAPPAVRRWSLLALGGLTVVALYLVLHVLLGGGVPRQRPGRTIGRPIANGVGSASEWVAGPPVHR